MSNTPIDREERLPPSSRWQQWLTNQYAQSVLAQVVSSGRNFLFLVIAARNLDQNAFGYVAVLVIIVTAANEILRAAASHPLALKFSAVAPGDERPLAGAVGYHLLLACGLAAAGTALALLVAPGPGGALALGLMLYPAVAGHDAVRVGSINRGRSERAVLIDMLWLVLLIPALIPVMRATSSAAAAVWLWGLSAGVSTVVVSWMSRIPLSAGEVSRYRAAIGRIGWDLVGQVALETIPTRVIPIVIAALVGASAAGGIRGAEMLFGVATVVASGLGLTTLRVARSRLDQHGPRAALQHVAGIFGAALVVLLVNLAVILSLPDRFGTFLLGESWEGAQGLAIPVSSLFAAFLALSVVTVMFRILLRFDLIYRVVALAAVFSLIVVPPAAYAAGARLAMYADAGAVALGAGVGFYLLIRRLRDPQTSSANPE